MKITLNGEEKEVPECLTITGLLEHLQIHPGRVAIEYNLEILLRSKWPSTQIQPGDRLEIVHFVGGG